MPLDLARAENVTGSDRPGGDRIIDMHPIGRTTRTVRIGGAVDRIGPSGVIEDDDAIGAGRVPQQEFDLAVVPLHCRVVVEVVDRGRATAELEAVAVEVEIVRLRLHVVDRDRPVLGLEENLGEAASQRR